MAIGRLPISAYCLVKRVTAKTQYGSCSEDDRERTRERGGDRKAERDREVHTENERKDGSAIGRDLCVEIT